MGSSAEQTLTELYSTHGPGALKLAYLMTGDGDAADEIVQEAFVRIFARLRNRRRPESLAAYLRRTVINLSHDRHRRLRTSRSYSSALRPTALIESGGEIDARLDMRSRLQVLPHRQRAALVLRFYEDLSEQDAAEILQCSAPALRQLVRRGVRTLRLQQQEVES
ncbi:MAG: hypothetical protein QOH90_1384 [Actinomycetota bacterium]|jgi:RNA polymerase sigma factor (sigma-70 family)|nr:hypothetical protein [Actinomycetota bacterium]